MKQLAPFVLIFFCSQMIASAEGLAGALRADPDARVVRFMPEIHFSADLSKYYLAQNSYLDSAYFLESHIAIEPLWISYRERLFFITQFEVNPVMGQKRLLNVLFDPRAIDYAITTIFEYRTAQAAFSFGEDHRCFHEIDRKDFPTVYWNMLYLGAASRNNRSGDFFAQHVPDGQWRLKERLSWHARWGVFLKGFFDIVTDSNVDYENSRIHEALAGARYAFLWRRAVVLCALSETSAGLCDEIGADKRAYWQQVFGAEAALGRHEQRFMLFINYFLDDMPNHRMWIPPYRNEPRFSKNRLLEIGMRAFL